MERFIIRCGKCSGNDVVIHVTAIQYGTTCRVRIKCMKCGNKEELESPLLRSVSIEKFESG